ncbi:hypothetical protein NP493_829g01084 [Ridgeia piscesae]|uniref:Uncharacterized protein n=1 Tax=Ridgeia piscesae TaxID=27915 RepID=A0AAD9NL71_RIDPI|nr:hypothetical protein NP493_829g01084 [Ridgeia piscesae]
MVSFICRVLLSGSLSTMFAPSEAVMWCSVVAWSVRLDSLMRLVYLSFLMLCASFLCSSSRVLAVSLSPPPQYTQFLHDILCTSSPCSCSATLSYQCTSMPGSEAVTIPYFFKL